MESSRIIFVEGIMGSGKTTTAHFLADNLQQCGIPTRFMLEGPTVTEPAHPLRVATDFPHPNAIWQDLTVEAYISYSLQKWRQFTAQTQRSATVTVCDGLLFHGNMTDLFLMDAGPEALHRYVEQVLEVIDALNPIVIYFYHTDIVHAIRVVCDERGSEWEAYQINWKVASPYGARRSLHGFAGLVQLYHAYCAICDEIFAQLPLPKLAIRQEGNWAFYYHDIVTFLQEVEPKRG
jgi:hypothetical protein